jgi:aminocarboxymuconate-semialdehyde decarboxylase
VIVDAHAHVIPRELLRDRAPAEEWRPRLVESPADRPSVLEIGGARVLNANHELVDPDRVLATLGGFGVEGALLSPFVGLLRYDAGADDCLASSQIQNDGIAALGRKYPGRVAGLGTVPLQDPGLAVRELERALGIGLKGVEVGPSVGGVYLGDARFRPFWEACDALGAFVFVHPVGLPGLTEYYMSNVVGNPVATATAAAHLVLSGTMDACPKLKILLAHGGGVVPSLRGRLDHGFRVRPETRHLPMRPSEYLRRFYYDTITHDETLLRELVAFAGADHVLLGSDYPFDMGTDDPAGEVRAADLGAEAEAKVLGGNAVSLLGL